MEDFKILNAVESLKAAIHSCILSRFETLRSHYFVKLRNEEDAYREATRLAREDIRKVLTEEIDLLDSLK